MSAYPLPQYVQLYPTDRCNQKCAFCFNRRQSRNGDMSYDLARDLLDMLSRHRISSLDIMGGESFLLSWMPEYLRDVIRRGIRVNISTNGSIPEVMTKLGGLTPEVINIGVSLEGSRADIHNPLTRSRNFAKTVESIRNLVSLGLDPLVKTVVNLQNRNDIQSLIDLLKSLGVGRYYLIHMDLFSRDPEDRSQTMGFVEFMRFFETTRAQNPEVLVNKVHASCFEKASLSPHVRCAGGVKKLAVMPDGSVYPCNLLQGVPDFLLGNIFTNDLHEVWADSRLGFFRQAEKNHCHVKGCANFVSCTGGCPAHGYFHGMAMNGADIRCMSHSVSPGACSGGRSPVTDT